VRVKEHGVVFHSDREGIKNDSNAHEKPERGGNIHTKIPFA